MQSAAVIAANQLFAPCITTVAPKLASTRRNIHPGFIKTLVFWSQSCQLRRRSPFATGQSWQ
jgi:hypothetical protein